MLRLNDAAGRYKWPLLDDDGRAVRTLLWGDPLHELAREGEGEAARVRVRARGRVGWLPAAVAAPGPGLLEVYVIDVGQGDGVLLRTPEDDAWHLIDAGIRAADQMTKKGAANFLRWKFIDDLRRDRVTLKTVMLSHPDADHYGGLVDVLSGRLPDGRRFDVEVQQLLHNGLGRYVGAMPLGERRSDIAAAPPQATTGWRGDDRFIVGLLAGKATLRRPPRPFERGFAEFAAFAAQVPARVRRLDHRVGWLPGYGASRSTRMRVLGPVTETLRGGGVGLRELGSDSVTRNGHSIVLRVDHGAARLLLTGDLNAASQRLLLAQHAPAEFEVDVAKGCHHGSDDIDLRFVKAMAARATVVSSGDNEDYAHPRPRVLGASARYGRESRGWRGVLPPLLYSTELARSVALGFVLDGRTRDAPPRVLEPDACEFRWRDDDRYRRLTSLPVATDLVYGLVNVRTDGRRILCATMEEKSGDFDLQVFDAGVAP